MATLLSLDGAKATPNQQLILRHMLRGYNKDAHPPNDVRLIFNIVYMSCPIPDAAGTLRSQVHETQVRYLASIGVGAQSTLGGGRDIFAGKLCMKN